jgi:hypothetical protein
MANIHRSIAEAESSREPIPCAAECPEISDGKPRQAQLKQTFLKFGFSL